MKYILIFIFTFLSLASFSQTDSLMIEEEEPFFDSFEIAYQEFTEKINSDSSDFHALIDRGDLVSGLNDREYFLTIFDDQKVYEEALEDYDKAVELAPYNHLPYIKRGRLNERFFFYEKALEDYEEALTYAWIKEDKMSARVSRARLKARLGKKDIAIKDLEKALLEDNKNVDLLNTLAIIHAKIEEYSKALKYLNRSLEYHPDDALTFSNIGFVALLAGKYQKAINIYDHQIEKDSTLYYMFSNRGFAKYKLGLKEEGLQDISYAIKMNPLNSYAFKNRAIILFHLEKKEEACADLQQAKKLNYSIKYDDEVIKMLFDKCLNVNQKRKF